MKITLKQLNEGFFSLQKASQVVFPKEHHKLAYKLSRIYKSANSEVDLLRETLRDLAAASGVTAEDLQLGREKCLGYWQAERKFLRETEIEIWGDPFELEQWELICEKAELSPIDMANLDWLFQGEIEEEKQKTAAG